MLSNSFQANGYTPATPCHSSRLPPSALRVLTCVLAGLPLFTRPVHATGVNGNDFALSYVEARSEAERGALLDKAGRRPHYFRYLQIMTLETVEGGRAPVIRIIALEPASLLDIAFTVHQPASLAILREAPAAEPGRAIAVSGVIESADPADRTLRLHPVIVRHRDRLAPATGKEMRYETHPDGIFYAFTGGKEPVTLCYRDRDLLRHRDRILKENGDQAWAEFLQRELRARAASRRHTGDTPP